jgi:hypothetical protein
MWTLHPSCIHILRWSLKRGVKQTWTGSAFSTKESAWSVLVTWVSFSCVEVALSPKSHEVNPCNVDHWEHGSWDLPLHTWSQVQSPNYDMDAYMAALFGGEAWDLCCELGRGQSETQLSTQVLQILLHKVIKIRLLMIFNHILVITRGSEVGTSPPCWDLLTQVGLGAWDPVWTGPKQCAIAHVGLENITMGWANLSARRLISSLDWVWASHGYILKTHTNDTRTT